MANNLSKGRGILITTNVFTTEAEKFADGKPIELIDGSKSVSLLSNTSKAGGATVIEERAEACPSCGGKLVKRHKFNDFMGCSNFPKCHYTGPLSR